MHLKRTVASTSERCNYRRVETERMLRVNSKNRVMSGTVIRFLRDSQRQGNEKVVDASKD